MSFGAALQWKEKMTWWCSSIRCLPILERILQYICGAVLLVFLKTCTAMNGKKSTHAYLACISWFSSSHVWVRCMCCQFMDRKSFFPILLHDVSSFLLPIHVYAGYGRMWWWLLPLLFGCFQLWKEQASRCCIYGRFVEKSRKELNVGPTRLMEIWCSRIAPSPCLFTQVGDVHPC